VIDGVPTTQMQIEKIDENEIAEIIVLKGKPATALYGKKAKNGAILISSKKGLTKIYQKNFSSISTEYANKIKLIKDESELIYIIDNTPIIEGLELKLSRLKRDQVKDIKLIDSDKLKMTYGLDKKDGAVVIVTK
jgi:hypothetical protein